MRWACEYNTKSGLVGLIIFNADNLNNAKIYLEELTMYHGHDHVWNLNQLTEGTIEEIYRLFPGLVSVSSRGHSQEISSCP